MTDLSKRILVKKMMATSAVALVSAAVTSPLAMGLPLLAKSASSAKISTRHHKLARGFNLPSWVDRIDGIAPSSFVLKQLYQLGFTSIRLPIDPAQLLSGDRKLIVFKIRTAVYDLNRLGFAVILDMHLEAPLIKQFSHDFAGARKVVSAAWDILALILADSPADKNYAELLNEPPLSADNWLSLRNQLASQVRQHCPKHTIMWGAAPYQSIYKTIEQPLLKDDNQIVGVHYYTPIGFTHQGADWSSDVLKQIKNMPFPAHFDDPFIVRLYQKLKRQGDKTALKFLEQEFEEDWTKQRIANDFANLGKWSKSNECPVVLNEFGVFNAHVDAFSRVNWIKQVRLSAEQNDIGWMYWELDHGFGFMDNRRQWKNIDKAVIKALFER